MDTDPGTILGYVSINGEEYKGGLDQISPSKLGMPITITWSDEYKPYY